MEDLTLRIVSFTKLEKLACFFVCFVFVVMIVSIVTNDVIRHFKTRKRYIDEYKLKGTCSFQK